MIKLFHITYVILYLIFGLSNQVFADGIDTKELNNKKMNLTFSNIHFDNNTIDSYTYYDFLRESIITQPEFLYANSNYIEKNQQLKFTKRQRWPELSVRIINDHVIDRDVSEQNSLRKRQDDSFDAAIELSQPLYSGGTINAQIRKALSDKNLSTTEKQNALSTLVLDANEIYLNGLFCFYNLSCFKIFRANS